METKPSNVKRCSACKRHLTNDQGKQEKGWTLCEKCATSPTFAMLYRIEWLLLQILKSVSGGEK